MTWERVGVEESVRKSIGHCFRGSAVALTLSVAMSPNPSAGYSQDTTGTRLAAAERYADTVDFQSMMDQAIEQMAASVPPNKRKAFLAEMAKVDSNWLRNLAVNSMVLTFTTDELNALADFYGSPVGRSIIEKMPDYMGTVLPAMEQGLIEKSKKVLSAP